MKIPVWILNTLLGFMLTAFGGYFYHVEGKLAVLTESDNKLNISNARMDEDLKAVVDGQKDLIISFRDWQKRVDDELTKKGWSPYRNLKK